MQKEKELSDKIIYLRWLDSASTPEWSSPASKYSGLAEVETVGYLVFEDDQHIQVAQSKFEDIKLGAILAIPKSVILERRTLKVLSQKATATPRIEREAT